MVVLHLDLLRGCSELTTLEAEQIKGGEHGEGEEKGKNVSPAPVCFAVHTVHI